MENDVVQAGRFLGFREQEAQVIDYVPADGPWHTSGSIRTTTSIWTGSMK
jgi:hypothetical protein